MPPYIIRDPSTLTADEFFSTLTKSEVLYMSDVIFKGYPLKDLRGILTDERKEEFFEKVWKPLVEQRITGSLTLKYDPELQGAKAYIGELRQAQIKLLEEHIDKFLVGQGLAYDEGEEEGEEEEEGGEGEAEGGEEEGEEEEGEEEKGEEGEEEKGEEGEEEEKEKEVPQPKRVTFKPAQEKPIEEKPAQEKPVKGKPTEEKPVKQKPATEKPATQKPAQEKPATQKPAQEKPVDTGICNRLSKDTTPDEFIQYIRAIYNLIASTTNGMPTEIDPYIASLEAIPIPNTVPAMEIKSNLQPLIAELKRVKNEMQKNKGTRRRSQGQLQHTLLPLTQTLKDSICKYYIQIKALNPGSRPRSTPQQGGKRVTRKKLSKSSYTIKSKHDKKSS